MATRARALLGIVALLVAWPFALACESNLPPPVAGSGPVVDPVGDDDNLTIQALLGDAGSPAAAAGDRDAAASTFHTLTVSLCARDADACARARGAAAASGTGAGEANAYRVAFGTTAGMLRTRGQAMTDLYSELRDRAGSGAHLIAFSHQMPAADAASAAPSNPPPRPPSDADEPFIRAAFELMEEVDAEGEVLVDSVAPLTSGHCKLAIGGPAVDGGAGRCVVEEPSRHRPSR